MDQEMRFYRLWNLLQNAGPDAQPFSFQIKHFQKDGQGDMALVAKLSPKHIQGRELPLWVWSMPSVAVQVLFLFVARLACGQNTGRFLDMLLEYGRAAPGEVAVFPTSEEEGRKFVHRKSFAFEHFLQGIKQIHDIDAMFLNHVQMVARSLPGVDRESQIRVGEFLSVIHSALTS